VPSGPDRLIPVPEVNPLVHRGLADLSDVSDSARHAFDLALKKKYNSTLRFMTLLRRVRELHAGRPARPPNSQHEVPTERSPEDLPPQSGNTARSS
jgi:hypothetical protein